MVKLADLPAGLPTVGGQAGTLASGASGREVVQVQVLFFGGKLQQRKYRSTTRRAGRHASFRRRCALLSILFEQSNKKIPLRWDDKQC